MAVSSEILNAINSLRSLDLKTTDVSVVREHIKQFGKIGMFGLNIPKDGMILRARADREFQHYSYEKEISYISDKNVIPDYNRASLRGKSFFYGCVPVTRDDEHLHQILAAAEISHIMPEIAISNELQEEYITMGKWRVVQDFTPMMIAHHQKFIDGNSQLGDMQKSYKEFINQFEQSDDFEAITSFLADEFAKKVEKHEKHNYKITGAFSEIAEEKGMQGLMYPSVAGQGQGFCVALQPSIVDTHLKLEKVLVWRLIRERKKVIQHGYLFCDKFEADGKFIWQPVKPLSDWQITELLKD